MSFHVRTFDGAVDRVVETVVESWRKVAEVEDDVEIAEPEVDESPVDVLHELIDVVLDIDGAKEGSSLSSEQVADGCVPNGLVEDQEFAIVARGDGQVCSPNQDLKWVHHVPKLWIRIGGNIDARTAGDEVGRRAGETVCERDSSKGRVDGRESSGSSREGRWGRRGTGRRGLGVVGRAVDWDVYQEVVALLGRLSFGAFRSRGVRTWGLRVVTRRLVRRFLRLVAEGGVFFPGLRRLVS